MFESWKVQDFAPGEGREQGAFKEDFPDQDWLDISVPGDVHRALISAGRILDPFYDRNETSVAWMEEREWWYRVKFRPSGGVPGDDERVILAFHGLDTYCVLYLNGAVLGRAQNMFREHIFDVTQKMRWGEENTLAVRFDPPLKHVDPDNPFKSSWGRTRSGFICAKRSLGLGGIGAPVCRLLASGARLSCAGIRSLRCLAHSSPRFVLTRRPTRP
jgi:beta-mannosidase